MPSAFLMLSRMGISLFMKKLHKVSAIRQQFQYDVNKGSLIIAKTVNKIRKKHRIVKCQMSFVICGERITLLLIINNKFIIYYLLYICRERKRLMTFDNLTFDISP